MSGVTHRGGHNLDLVLTRSHDTIVKTTVSLTLTLCSCAWWLNVPLIADSMLSKDHLHQPERCRERHSRLSLCGRSRWAAPRPACLHLPNRTVGASQQTSPVEEEDVHHQASSWVVHRWHKTSQAAKSQSWETLEENTADHPSWHLHGEAWRREWSDQKDKNWLLHKLDLWQQG